MQFSRMCAFILIFLKNNLCLPLEKEPRCSKFAFEEQVLEKTIRQEINVEVMKNEITKTQESVVKTLENLKVTDVVVGNTLETLQRNFTEMSERHSLDTGKNEEALRQTFDELRTNLTKEIEEQNRIVAGLKEALRQTFDELQTNLSKDIEKEIVAGLKEDMKKPSVAFFASNVVNRKLYNTDIIVFTSTTTNEGSGYDTSTGIFTAPVGGLYQFIVNFCSYSKQEIPLALVTTGNIISRSFNHDKDSCSCASFPAVVRVEIGQKIWVKCINRDSSCTLFQSNWMMNTFSGFLINK